MRIVEQSPALVRLRFSQIVPGLVIAVVGLLVSWLFLDTCKIRLSRDAEGAVTCRIENSRVGQKRVRVLRHVERAAVDRIESRDRGTSSTHSYRAVLITRGGQAEHPVTSYTSGNRQSHDGLADAVNRFIQNGDVRYAEHTIGWGYGWLILLVPVVGAFVALGFRGECVVDGLNGRVLLTRWRPWGSQRLSIPLEQVQSFQLLHKGGSKGSLYAPGILCRDGRQIAFSDVWSSGYSFKKHALLETLNALLPPPALGAQASSSPARMGSRRSIGHQLFPLDGTPATSPLPDLAPIMLSNQKTCALCGEDCSQGERLRDENGRYYHPHCHAAHLAGLD